MYNKAKSLLIDIFYLRKEDKMTVEELEVVVNASIEPAMKEIKKLMPQFKKEVEKVAQATQKTIEQIDMKNMTKQVQQAVQVIKQKMDTLKQSSKNSEITLNINNKEAEKQISQIEKQIISLQDKINARQMKLDMINPQIEEIMNNTKKEVIPDGISQNDSSMDAYLNQSLSRNTQFTVLDGQAQKLYTEIELYNQKLNAANSKMEQLKQENSETTTNQGKLTSLSGQFQSKLGKTKELVGNLKSAFNAIHKVTSNITNGIMQIGKGIKQGLVHVFKYVSSLFSLKNVYNILRGCAQSWLSSQNTQAQQLSANIEYMKYAMRRCICTCNRIYC